ncbi:MAG: putative virulence factor [Rhodospirillaceae bacterium]|nr:putative virulence factor [Rhodospirillaceae bacterium]
MTSTPENLVARCAAVVAGAADAVDWITDVRGDSVSLESSANELIEYLRRCRNSARRLGAAAARPMAVGFFGLSQAGKSYLISALARGGDGSVETVMDGHRLNFISHINPPGSGKEATGIVTRFTRQVSAGPDGFPVVLALLTEADLLKIIGNSFFLDFDPQKVELCAGAEVIRDHLSRLKKRVQPQETGGMTADDVVDVMDYFVKRFPNSMGVYLADFWPTAICIAPRLQAEDRADLFSLLWGGIEELTAAYLRLRQGLARLGHAPVVFAELSALVCPDGAGGFIQGDSIMNVDMLARLGRDDDDLVNVVPQVGGDCLSSVGIPRSLLAALSREMAFALAEPPEASLLEQVDLLDFPGYRGRLKVANLKEVAEKLESRDPVGELILRGKVAYLFERYTDDQEMNVLVMCTPCHKQSDVNDLGGALTEWISSTQGETPEERLRRKPGLVWALTMFDMRLTPRPDETEDLIRSGWAGMMRLALLEKFEQFDWVNAWTPGQPFTNLFLVRKPGMAAGVIRNEGRREVAVESDQQSRLDMLRKTFVADATVCRHFGDAAAAWDAMMALDDGGMGALLAYLEHVARREVKLERIAEQVDKIVREVTEVRLGEYYRSNGADEVARKTLLAEKVVQTVRKRASSLGELLALMQPKSEYVRALYLRSESENEDKAAAETPVSSGFISLDLDLPAKEAEPSQAGGVQLFIQALISGWKKQLRGLPSNQDVHRFLGMSSDVLQIVVDEVIAGASRAKIEKTLSDILRDAEDRAGTTRTQLVDQQVLVARGVIAEYVDTLGYLGLPEHKIPKSSVYDHRRVFQAPPFFDGLPQISDRPLNYPAIRILDWLDAFTATTIDNAGHDEGREITPEQNVRLGAILQRIAGADEQKVQ